MASRVTCMAFMPYRRCAAPTILILIMVWGATHADGRQSPPALTATNPVDVAAMVGIRDWIASGAGVLKNNATSNSSIPSWFMGWFDGTDPCGTPNCCSKSSNTCAWQGVCCTNWRVVQLDLGCNACATKIRGQLPASQISSLTELRLLNLSNHEISGGITPVSWWALQMLTTLDLSKNWLDGSLPDLLSNLSSLQLLYLDTNGFSGGLPSSWGALTDLRIMSLARNQLSGRMSITWGQLPYLQRLDLSDNCGLCGSLPGFTSNPSLVISGTQLGSPQCTNTLCTQAERQIQVLALAAALGSLLFVLLAVWAAARALAPRYRCCARILACLAPPPGPSEAELAWATVMQQAAIEASKRVDVPMLLLTINAGDLSLQLEKAPDAAAAAPAPTDAPLQPPQPPTPPVIWQPPAIMTIRSWRRQQEQEQHLHADAQASSGTQVAERAWAAAPHDQQQQQEDGDARGDAAEAGAAGGPSARVPAAATTPPFGVVTVTADVSVGRGRFVRESQTFEEDPWHVHLPGVDAIVLMPDGDVICFGKLNMSDLPPDHHAITVGGAESRQLDGTGAGAGSGVDVAAVEAAERSFQLPGAVAAGPVGAAAAAAGSPP